MIYRFSCVRIVYRQSYCLAALFALPLPQEIPSSEYSFDVTFEVAVAGAVAVAVEVAVVVVGVVFVVANTRRRRIRYQWAAYKTYLFFSGGVC